MPPSDVQSDPYAPWRCSGFRQYAGSWFLIVFSRRIEFVAVSIFLAKNYSPQQAAFLLGIMGLVQALPVIALAIPGGHLADRFDRKWVMTLSYLLGIAASVGLLATALVHGPVSWLFTLLGVAAAGWALGNPARQAILPQLVPAKIFSKSVAWNSTAFYMASVTGPIVGGVLVAISPDNGMAVAFAVVVLCRAIAVAAIALLKVRPANHLEESTSWRSVVAGIRFVWRNKVILATMTLDMFAVLLGGATYLISVFAEHILHVGPRGLGVLLAADALGAICMVMLIAHRPPFRRAGLAMLCAVAAFGGATVVFGLSQWFWLSFVAMFLVGAFDNISVVVRHTLVQMLTPDEMRGRVSAVNGIFIVASNDLGGLESGLTAKLFGSPVTAVVVGGFGAILVVLGVAWLWPQLLKVGALDSVKPISMPELEQQEELAER